MEPSDEKQKTALKNRNPRLRTFPILRSRNGVEYHLSSPSCCHLPRLVTWTCRIQLGSTSVHSAFGFQSPCRKMGNASSSFKRNADKDELLADFELLDMVKVEDSRRYFSTKFDYHNHLLSFFQFDDVYLSWFGVRSHRHFKCFGVEIVSALDLFIVGYLLCSAKLLSFNERLEYAMAFFQFPTASDEGSDGSADRIQTRANVRKDEVMLFIETAACAFSRLASINLVEQQYVISIIDQIFGTEQFKPWEQVKVQIMMNQVSVLINYD